MPAKSNAASVKPTQKGRPNGIHVGTNSAFACAPVKCTSPKTIELIANTIRATRVAFNTSAE